ncbi:MAG: HD domain-containing protein, partial [Nitrospirota bacterium]
IAIRNLQNLWMGSYPSLATFYDAFKGLKRRWVLILAVLLHDLGKAYRFGHEYKGVDLAETILARLGIGGEDKERVLFLVRNHLLMSRLSQRRELTERKVIADFSRRVRDRENLAMLYLLTYADISAVTPTAWTQWKATLLQDLYIRTIDYLDRSAQIVEEEQTRLLAALTRIKKAAEARFSPEEIDAFLTAMPDQYILYTPVHKVIDHMGLMKRLPDEKLVVHHRHYHDKGYTELTVCAYDAYGMFYRTAGTIAAKNLNILRAQVYTSKNGVMIDTFQITDPEGNIYTYDDSWESVSTDLRVALMSAHRPPEPGIYVSARVLSAAITPSVEIDNDTSDSFTIIDVSARDRVGFLYHVAKTLYDLNLDIGSAKIVTEGARVMDSFYVTDLLRKKITDSVRLERIKTALLDVLK